MLKGLPGDPVMLLSVINTKLRDHYRTLEELCDDLDIPVSQLTKKLQAIDYEYDGNRNQFV